MIAKAWSIRWNDILLSCLDMNKIKEAASKTNTPLTPNMDSKGIEDNIIETNNDVVFFDSTILKI